MGANDEQNKTQMPDFYWENGFLVFTEAYHLKRGYCCKNSCRHCPYGFKTSAKPKVTISWSGGKDSALALYKIINSKKYDVVGLHTIINQQTKRVGMHGVSEVLIEQQAHQLNIPLAKLYLESSESHDEYETLMRSYYKQCANDGISFVVFGDIFLEDLKKFREDILRASGLIPIFPLWKINSTTLINDFISTGFKTLICSANAKFFSANQLGKTIDEKFINTLPPEVDVCGENGEFHTFVYDGPLFKRRVIFDLGKVVVKHYNYKMHNADGSISALESKFWFQNLLPRMA